MKAKELKNSGRLKLNLVRFAVLAAASYFGISSSSHADFTFNVDYSNGGGYATFLAEGASNMSSFSLHPGDLLLESITNESGKAADFGSFQVSLQSKNPAKQPLTYVFLPNDPPPQLVPEGGKYVFEYSSILATGSQLSSILCPTWDLCEALSVKGSWTAPTSTKCAPEPLTILGAFLALGFGILLKRFKLRLTA